MNEIANLLFPAQTGGAAPQAGEAASTSGWLVLAFIVAIFVLPIVLGNLLGRLLKLKEFSSRISVVLFAVFLGVAPFAWHLIQGRLAVMQYETALATWNERANRSSNQISPQDDGVRRLESALPDLTIRYPAQPAAGENGTNIDIGSD